MTEAEGPVPPELEVTAEDLKHVQANVYDHTVLCLPAAYVRAVPGLAPNVSGGYVQNSDDPRVSDVKTLWVGRAAELAAAMGKFKAATAERRAETLEYLEIREKQYDERVEMDLYAADDAGAAPVIENAVTYIATPADINLNWLGDADEIAEQIARAVGPSGANSDYLYNLCEALRALDIEDDDLYALEASVRAIRGD